MSLDGSLSLRLRGHILRGTATRTHDKTNNDADKHGDRQGDNDCPRRLEGGNKSVHRVIIPYGRS